MIIEPIKDGNVYTLTPEISYFFCTYNADNQILIYRDEVVDGKCQTESYIFGADTIENMDLEIIARGLEI